MWKYILLITTIENIISKLFTNKNCIFDIPSITLSARTLFLFFTSFLTKYNINLICYLFQLDVQFYSVQKEMKVQYSIVGIVTLPQFYPYFITNCALNQCSCFLSVSGNYFNVFSTLTIFFFVLMKL